MRTVYLHGALAEEYGPSFELDVQNFGEAVRALEANFPGFMRRIRAGNWYLSYGEHDKDEGLCFTEDMLRMQLGNRKPIHFIPEAVGMGGGGKGKGVAMTVIGIVIIAVAIYFAPPAGAALAGSAGTAGGGAAATGLGAAAFAGVTYGSIALFGAALALSGIATLLTPVPEAPNADLNREDADSRASFLFNGPVNTIEQGGPVPLVYGRHMVGSKVVSGGIQVEDIS